jgi:HEAT repeat protein
LTIPSIRKPNIAATLYCLSFLVFAGHLSGGVAVAQTGGSEVSELIDPSVEPATPAAVVKARETLRAALESTDLPVRINALRAALGIREEWLGEVAMARLGAPDLTERVLAYQVVATTDPGIAKEELIKALRSGERTIRLRALLGLGALGASDTVPDVVRVLKEDPDPDLRAAAARALGAIGDPLASLALINALSSEFSPVREQAVLALVKIGESDLVPVLTRRLHEGDDPDKINIMRLLRLIPDPALIETIRPYLESGNDELRCEAAASVLVISEGSGTAQP